MTFDSVTASDGRGLSLRATGDITRFSAIAHDAIDIANRHGWRVTQLDRRNPGGNIESVTITPAR